MHHNLTPAQLENLPEVVMSETVASYIPPIAEFYQAKLETNTTIEQDLALLAEWAMKTGLRNNINERHKKADDKLMLYRRGIPITAI